MLNTGKILDFGVLERAFSTIVFEIGSVATGWVMSDDFVL